MSITLTANISESLPQQKHYSTPGIEFFRHTIEESILDIQKKSLSVFATSNLYTIEDEFTSYLNFLDYSDRSAVESSISKIKSYPFVDSVGFKNGLTPTIIVNLSEVNRDHEKMIYAIEYNLLRETNVDINFDIDFS